MRASSRKRSHASSLDRVRELSPPAHRTRACLTPSDGLTKSASSPSGMLGVSGAGGVEQTLLLALEHLAGWEQQVVSSLAGLHMCVHTARMVRSVCDACSMGVARALRFLVCLHAFDCVNFPPPSLRRPSPLAFLSCLGPLSVCRICNAQHGRRRGRGRRRRRGRRSRSTQ
jgi:hypothetical protein